MSLRTQGLHPWLAMFVFIPQLTYTDNYTYLAVYLFH